MVYTLRFFSLKCSLFHNSNLFGSCIIHVLYTESAKIKKNNSGAKRLIGWRIWLRHCAVAGSIPDVVFGIFYWHNSSGRTMTLGSTQPLAEMSTKDVSWKIKAAGAYGWQSYYLHMPIVLKYGSLNLLEPQGVSRPVLVLLYLYISFVSFSMNFL